MIHVAVDVGGTFTDVCVLDDFIGSISVAKVSSTRDPIDAVLDGINAVGVNAQDIDLFSHGSTVATNALITRNLPRTAMVTTEGFRDVIEIRRGTKEDLWDPYNDVTPPYIRRRDRLEISGRIDYSGVELLPLDEDEVRRVARIIGKRGINTIAVCLVNAHMTPDHEKRVEEILREELPDASLSTSSEVLPEIFEHERFSTTVVNAVLAPLIGKYARDLAERLKDRGYRGDVLLLHSGGGVMTADVAERLGARLGGSGLAAGAIAGAHIAKLAGYKNAVGLDMGGTSADISVVVDGEIGITNEWYVEFGYPIGFPSVDLRTLGAGGGSIAWIDSGGSLRSGPQSAGADPGPACYDKGGAEPTTTDANLVLGRLGDQLVGGAMSLDRARAESAVGNIGKALNLDTIEAARAIVRVANSNLANATRLPLIGRGHDPRDFVLVAFGGAGPLHATEVAQELAIPTIVVPRHPGITSAMGCLLVDIRHDFSQMHFVAADDTSPEELEGFFAALEKKARERLEAEGIAPGDMRLLRSLDMRYLGQWRSIEVAVDGPIESMDDLAVKFSAEHERQHTYKRDGYPVEIYQLKITALGVTSKPDLPQEKVKKYDPKPQGSRSVVFDAGTVETPVYQRDLLTPGARIPGPAVIEQLDSTVLVTPGDLANVDQWSNIVITVGGAE